MRFDPEILLEHADFARRLALSLAGDSHRADDLVQDAWADVLDHPPADGHSPRGFLATVLRRTSARTTRSDMRRRRREKSSARPEPLPSTAELAERIEVQRRVVEALGALAPAYRRAVLLRFYDGLTPAEIAARSGEPVETVRTRIKRGLARLRRHLDSEFGSRAGWASVLVPSASVGSVSTSAFLATWMVVSMSRTAIGIVGVVLTLVVAWLAWPDPLGATSTAKSDSTAIASAPDTSARPTAPDPTPTPTNRVEVEQPEEAHDSALAITGSVVVIDTDGTEHDTTSGEIVVKIQGETETRAIAVDGGEFGFGIAARAGLSIESLTLDGRQAWLETNKFEFTKDLQLRATWLPAARLRVVDAATRGELTGVSVLRDVPIYRGRRHPGTWKPEHVIARNSNSPVALPPVDGVVQYWVRANGYAWESIEFAHRTGGERIVALQYEARLNVHLDTFEPDWNFKVRLYDPDAREFGPCVAESRPHKLESGGGEIEFSGLRAGTMRVDAHIGNWWDPPLVVGRATANLIPGSTTQVSLTLDAERLPEPVVELAGTLDLPAAWQDIAVGLKLVRTDGPPPRDGDWRSIGADSVVNEPGRPGVRRWSLGRVTPGPYIIVIDPLQVIHRIELTAPGQRNVHIHVPELAEVVAKLTESPSGQAIDLDKIAWGRPTPEGVNTWSFENVDYDASVGGYRFVAPVGPISLMVRDDRYADIHRQLRVQPGANPVALTTHALPSRWIRFVDGGAVVPVSWSMRFTITSTDGASRGHLGNIENGRAKLVVPEDGRYEVVLPTPKGFEAVEPRTVSFGAADNGEIVVKLRRQH